jgi:hypothetical protein
MNPKMNFNLIVKLPRFRLELQHIRIIAKIRSDVNREWFNSNYIIHLGIEP